MAEKVYKMGDMLPGGLLTEEEWQLIKKEFEQEPDTKSESFRQMIVRQCIDLTKTHWVGENDHKCLFCGKETKRMEGLCNTCYNAIRVRGVLRQCGHTHDIKNADLACIVCGKKPAISKGVCKSCFYKMERRGFKTPDELIRFNESNAIVDPASGIFVISNDL